MSQKYSHITILSGVILILGLACITTVTVPTPQQPVSTSNPSVFSTTVAGTAAAFISQTMEAMPSPTASFPPPADTQTPEPTPTPVIETPTLTDAEVQEEDTSLSEMEDESTQFFDYLAGVKLTFPAGWLAVRLSGQEYQDAKNDSEKSSVIEHSLATIQDLDPVIYRVHAFNSGEGYEHEGEGSQIAVLFVEGDTQELELIAEAEVQPKNFEGYEFITFAYQERADNLTLFTLEETWQVPSSTEQQVEVYHRRVVFKVTAGTVYIDLQVPSEVKDDVVGEFNAMIEQLSIFTP